MRSPPWILRALLLVMALQLVVDAAGLALGWSTAGAATLAAEMFALALDVLLAVLLLGGREWVRRLLQTAAALGFAIDLVLAVTWWAYAPERSGVTAAIVAVLLSGSAFTWWALGHRATQAWVFERWLQRTAPS